MFVFILCNYCVYCQIKMQFFDNHGEFNKNKNTIVKSNRNHILAHNLKFNNNWDPFLRFRNEENTKKKKKKRKHRKQKNEERLWLFLSLSL